MPVYRTCRNSKKRKPFQIDFFHEGTRYRFRSNCMERSIAEEIEKNALSKLPAIKPKRVKASSRSDAN
jgi:hypothetical protein